MIVERLEHFVTVSVVGSCVWECDGFDDGCDDGAEMWSLYVGPGTDLNMFAYMDCGRALDEGWSC